MYIREENNKLAIANEHIVSIEHKVGYKKNPDESSYGILLVNVDCGNCYSYSGVPEEIYDELVSCWCKCRLDPAHDVMFKVKSDLLTVEMDNGFGITAEREPERF